MANTLSKQRLYLFYALACAIPLLFFVALEAGLRWFDYGYPRALFLPAPAGYANEPYLLPNREVARRYFGRDSFAPAPQLEPFRKQKPANGYRIFVLGESTTAGWPYPPNMLFSRILNQRLSDTFPDRYIEVVNLGIAAVNTFTLTDFMDEVLAQQPDAILIYAGHNEFYGALGAASSVSVGQSRWLIKVYLALLNFKTVELLRDTVMAARAWLSAGKQDAESSTLMGRMIANGRVEPGGAVAQAARANYAANLREIMAKAKAAKVPVLISEVVSNVHDHKPFVSIDDGKGPSANAVYAQAQQLEREGKIEQARAAYYRAKDLDGLPFRAPESFNEVIHAVAAEFGAPVVPMKAYFEAASPNGLIGANLMLEHLHPNAEGYFLMSEAFFDSMQRAGFISPVWRAERMVPASVYRRSWPVTALDRRVAEMFILNLTDHPPFPPKRSGEPTLVNFMPATRLDTLAYKVFRGEISYMDAHIEMAAQYEADGNPELAFKEYQTLMAADPYNINAYITAAEYLLQRNDFDRALPLLYMSREIRDTAFANKWIGMILLQRHNPRQALPFLEKARVLSPKDEHLLYHLGLCYVLTGQLEPARYTLGQLTQVAPRSARVQKLGQAIRDAEQAAVAGMAPAK